MRTRARIRAGVATGLFAALALTSLPAKAQLVCTDGSQTDVVRFVTDFGDIDVVLCSEDVPITVDNFLSYVDDGSYANDGIIHRSVMGPDCENSAGICVIQGGGFFMRPDGVMDSVPKKDPIQLEAVLDHEPYTIAAARTSQPNTATSQWYISWKANPALDGNYAVFGQVIAGTELVDDIAQQEIWSLNAGVLSEVPLVDYPGGGESHIPYLVYVTDIIRVPEPAAGLQLGAGIATLFGLARRRARGRAHGS